MSVSFNSFPFFPPLCHVFTSYFPLYRIICAVEKVKEVKRIFRWMGDSIFFYILLFWWRNHVTLFPCVPFTSFDTLAFLIVIKANRNVWNVKKNLKAEYLEERFGVYRWFGRFLTALMFKGWISNAFLVETVEW